MTCEVAVMNTRGIALAADSAVTMDGSEKVYSSAEKLFQLAPNAPVGIMTFGNAALMGVPWEVVIAFYRRARAGRGFDTLQEYANDFIAFIEQGPHQLFPEEVQRSRFLNHARGMWTGLYAKPLREWSSENGGDPDAHLLELLREDHRVWENRYEVLDDLDDGYADIVLDQYSADLDEIEREVFERDDLPWEIRSLLRQTLRYFLTRAAFLGADDSGVVIAGMGDAEPFPSILEYRVGTITQNRLKCLARAECRVTHENNATVAPFAQRSTIDLLIDGIHPDLRERLYDLAEESAARPDDSPCECHAERMPVFEQMRLDQRVMEEVQEKHIAPFMAAVAMLPRHDLAALAETLVNLTAFRSRITVNQRETVSGPIDVAVLSKGEGFVWVKRKSLSPG